MREIIFLTIVVLLIIFVSSIAIFFVTQNTQLTTLNFGNYYIPNAPLGLVVIIAFFTGVIFMWIMLIIIYFSTTLKLKQQIRNLIREKEVLEKKLKQPSEETNKGDLSNAKKTN